MNETKAYKCGDCGRPMAVWSDGTIDTKDHAADCASTEKRTITILEDRVPA